MKKFFRSFVVAFSMYSKIPMPRVEWDDESMRYAMCFFPLIGLAIGLLEWLWWNLTQWLNFDTLFQIAGILILPILVTGGIHFDGFMDTVDALSSWKSREERLRILKDSHIGAFSVIWTVVYFLAAAGAASEITSQSTGVLCLCFMLSRSLSGLSVVTFPNANPKGTANSFAEHAQKKNVRITMFLYIGILGVVMFLLNPAAGISCLAAAGLSFWIYHHVSLKYFGGMTGDLAGFFVSLCELLMLLFCVVTCKLL